MKQAMRQFLSLPRSTLAPAVIGIVLVLIGASQTTSHIPHSGLVTTDTGSVLLLLLASIASLQAARRSTRLRIVAWVAMAICMSSMVMLIVVYRARDFVWSGTPQWLFFDAVHALSLACCALALTHLGATSYRQACRRFLDNCTLAGALTMALWATPYGQALLDHGVAASLIKAALLTMFFVVTITCVIAVTQSGLRRPDYPLAIAWLVTFAATTVVALVGTFGVAIKEDFIALPMMIATTSTVVAAHTRWPAAKPEPPEPAPALVANLAIITAIIALWVQSAQTTKYMTIAIALIGVMSLVVTVRNSLSGWEIGDLVNTLRKREQQLAYDASHDPLTRLVNRREFNRQLTAALDTPNRGPVHLAFIDLDGFKTINDAHGHGKGDEALVRFAQMLKQIAPADSLCGRLSGDEFAVLMSADHDPPTVAERISRSAPIALNIPSSHLDLTASIGVATAAPGDPVKADDLTYQADLAMYVVKHDRRAGFAVHSPTLAGPFFDDRVLGPALQDALSSGTVDTYYQPIFDLQNDALAGFEALSRWEHQGARIAPDRFISLAERGGMIDDLTWLVMSRVVSQLNAWQHNACAAPLDVSVNISGPTLANPHLIHHIIDLTTEFDVDPSHLTIEVTESAPIRDMAAANDLLVMARRHGIHVSLDDFGTGCNSIAHLLQLPISKAKIDPSMVRGIEKDPERATVVSGMVALAKQRGLHVVAEGVETLQQQELLQHMGVDYIQGFLVGRPEPAECWSELVTHRQKRSV